MQFLRFTLRVLACLVLAAPVAAQLSSIDPQMLNLPPIAGAREALRQEILSTKARLDKCAGPPTCPERTLLQARLNQLLKMGITLATDPLIVEKPLEMPTDSTDYESEQAFLLSKIRQEGQASVYAVSEDRAKVMIIEHCKVMKGLTHVRAFLTSDETKALTGAAGAAKTTADVNACIREYDAKAIAATRKSAIEYCFQSSNYTTAVDAAARFDACMNRHDMLQAMCKQQLELQAAYSTRKNPEIRSGPQTCPGLRLSPGEVQRVQSVPATAAMAELPAKFFPPPPDLSVRDSAPSVAIPPGTVIEMALGRAVDAKSAEQQDTPNAYLTAPLLVGGREVLPASAPVFLKTRTLGPGAFPSSVRIGLTTDWARTTDHKRLELKSDELVVTVGTTYPLPPGFDVLIPANAKLRFIFGTASSAATPAAQPAPASPSSVPPPATVASPPAAPPPATAGSARSDPQQRAGELRKQAERSMACMQQAMSDHPRGGVELTQALTACAQTK